MIHHVSIPACDPQAVAAVLAKLTGWQARPFLGPCPGAIMMLAEDDFGTAIEVYPDGTEIVPGEGEVQGHMRPGATPSNFPFHLLLSLDVTPEHVLAVAEDAGWRALRCWRGPPTDPVFELIEVWVENRFLIEVATPEMLANYRAAATAAAHDAFIAKMRAPQPA
jgi:hypothetical protein